MSKAPLEALDPTHLEIARGQEAVKGTTHNRARQAVRLQAQGDPNPGLTATQQMESVNPPPPQAQLPEIVEPPGAAAAKTALGPAVIEAPPAPIEPEPVPKVVSGPSPEGPLGVNSVQGAIFQMIATEAWTRMRKSGAEKSAEVMAKPIDEVTQWEMLGMSARGWQPTKDASGRIVWKRTLGGTLEDLAYTAWIRIGGYLGPVFESVARDPLLNPRGIPGPM